jgi:hypothetical protein
VLRAVARLRQRNCAATAIDCARRHFLLSPDRDAFLRPRPRKFCRAAMLDA